MKNALSRIPQSTVVLEVVQLVILRYVVFDAIEIEKPQFVVKIFQAENVILVGMR